MNRCRHASRALRSQEGFALIEVVVSAAVLALLAVTILAGVDGASRSTGREKARSIAANLAEQDQERMRSMQADTLAVYSETRDVPVDGSTYQVESTGRWVSDVDGGTPSCQNDSQQADYLQISSRVTNPTVGSNTPPVQIESLVAPSVAYSTTRGALVVQVNDRDGVGVPGLGVGINGPAARTGVTNQDGCAIFLTLPVGNYNISLNRPGWVDHFGNTAAIGNQDVTAGTFNVRTIDYDIAGSSLATIGTWKPRSTTTAAANLLTSYAVSLSAVNGGEPGMQRAFAHTTPGTRFNQLTLDNLFPFLAMYGVFTGACPEASPVNYDPDYFPSYTGSVLVDRGASPPVTVRQPPFNLRVKDRNGAYIDQIPTRPVRIKATLKTDTAECVEPAYWLVATQNPEFATVPADLSGWASQTVTPNFDPGMPFGTYDLCIDYMSDIPGGRWRRYTHNVAYDNTAPLGQTTTLTLPPDPANDWSSQSTSNKCAP